MQLYTLQDAQAALDALAAAREVTSTTAWNAAQALTHCAQSIAYSVQGYPEYKPTLVRRTIGPVVVKRMLARETLGHGLTAPVPGAPPLDAAVTVASAVAEVRRAITLFENATTLAEHFVFGRLDRAAFDRFHAMHLAEHLSHLRWS